MENEYGTYYGSTIKSLKDRLSNHKAEAKHKKKNKCTSKILFQNGAIPKIQLIEEIEFDDIKELWDREAYYIRNLECINKYIPNRTKKVWIEDNKQQIAKQKKEYREANKGKLLEQKKQYYEANKEKITQQQKQYREANKDIINEKAKIKISCQCGSVVRKSDFAAHCKSKKHQKFINSQNIVI
tara:strand:+ start:124 stop:675 length:552 start_codon:yes stop_codon:yes gene_type:complete